MTYSKLCKLQTGSKTHKAIKNTIYNVLKNKLKAKSGEVIWTCPKSAQKKLTPKGYTTAFVPSSLIGTNAFQDRSIVCYILNKNINPTDEAFLNQYGIEIDADLHALSEMIQFIWRSSIRKNEPITIYLPSEKMRTLLKMWLNCELN